MCISLKTRRSNFETIRLFAFSPGHPTPDYYATTDGVFNRNQPKPLFSTTVQVNISQQIYKTVRTSITQPRPANPP